MNLWTTWTSGEGRERSSRRGSHTLTTPLGSLNALHSVQKTSGLFDTFQAGNETVAGKASKHFLYGDMEPGTGFALGTGDAGLEPGSADLGELLPLDMMEGDFLDSFLDLSNFLDMQDSDQAAVSAVNMGDVNGKLDFSGITSHLDTEPAVTITEIPTPSVGHALKKRKFVEYSEGDDADVDVITVKIDEGPVDLGPEVAEADHDYVVRKKQKLATIADFDPTAVEVIDSSASECRSAPVHVSTSGRGKDKYRERRDKNNEASRRSRQIRKNKFKDMDKEADELEHKNETLRKKIVELEAMAKTMKAMLIQKMTAK
ncbi:uncharacterized protein LOC128234666 [Mya arenaria]|uniref:uncharacterized protein LOC128234666 n=1 Tax=Mya arenaria TaxID=6604 RepID=UPI0022E00B2B|nr:uncharacterized protein LOC128234666 [Mya arenaria]